MSSEPSDPAAGGVRPRTHHVWVRTPDVPVEHQGLLFYWYRYPDGWKGLVAWIDRTGRAVAPTWVPAGCIRPIYSPPNTGSMYDASAGALHRGETEPVAGGKGAAPGAEV